MASGRLNKVAEAIKEEVAQIIQRQLKDPRIGFVTVTRVQVTADLQHATVYFSILEGQGTLKETQAGLESSRGFIRRLLGERLRIKMTPEVHFKADPSVAESIRISKLLDDLHKQRGEDA
ncbi:MAG: 30S ribosome-binding factor RbfA [Candidatus Omnitrophica bacterium]|nr:30S ribosome-binding factor RbfA [Candidatus Omnitrophota bacterium]